MAYETIHDWQVSLAIPDKARAVLKADFERWIAGEVPYHMIIGKLNSTPVEIRLGNDIALLQRLWEESIEKIRESALANPMTDKALAEHCLYGSTVEIPPSPFITLASYLRGQPVDVYDRVVAEAKHRKYKKRIHESVIQGSGFFWGIDVQAYWTDPDKNRYFADINNHPIINVALEIDLDTRVARMSRA